MRLTMTVQEGTLIESPLHHWYRIWRHHEPFFLGGFDVAIIPLCWILRLGWKLWTYTYAFRPSLWERTMQEAYQAGFEKGVLMGHLQHRSRTIDDYLREGLWRRMEDALSTESQEQKAGTGQEGG